MRAPEPESDARSSATVTPSIEQRVDSARAGGRLLPMATRTYFESRFGQDFSQVRVHSDAGAAASARDMGARAYTVGHDVVFGASQYAPDSAEGNRLLAHELTHVVQQGQAAPTSLSSSVEDAGEFPDPRSPVQLQTGEGIQGDWDWARAGWGALIGGGIGVAAGIGVGLAVAAAGLPLLGALAFGVGLMGGLGLVEGFLYGGLTGKPKCDYSKIASAAQLSVTWLNQAIAKLAVYIILGSLADDPRLGIRLLVTRGALQRHFNAGDAATAEEVLGRLIEIHDRIKPWTNANNPNPDWSHSAVCSGGKDEECDGSVRAYVSGAGNTAVTFCPDYFGASETGRAETLIHEIAHTLGAEVLDRGYTHERIYPRMTTENALRNAESYSNFVQEIGGPRPELTAPKDTYEDCPADWKSKVQDALAKADFANRTASRYSKESLGAWFTSLNLTEDGEDAKDAYKEVESDLNAPLGVECEPEGGGRCDGGDVYWYGIWSDLHICPSWTQQGEESRTQTLLAGLYGHLAGVDPASRREHYAQVATEIAETSYGLTYDEASAASVERESTEVSARA